MTTTRLVKATDAKGRKTMKLAKAEENEMTTTKTTELLARASHLATVATIRIRNAPNGLDINELDQTVAMLKEAAECVKLAKACRLLDATHSGT